MAKKQRDRQSVEMFFIFIRYIVLSLVISVLVYLFTSWSFRDCAVLFFVVILISIFIFDEEVSVEYIKQKNGKTKKVLKHSFGGLFNSYRWESKE